MMMQSVPNALTIYRIVISPIIIWLLLAFNGFTWHFIALFLFTTASLSDLFDGMIARKYDVESEFGKFMDPLADKILVNGMFITLNVLEIVPVWITGVIIIRDLAVTFLRWYMIKNGESMETSKLGKWKTAFQIISMYVGLLTILLNDWPATQEIAHFIEDWSVSHVVFILTGIMTAFTGLHYYWVNRASIFKNS